MTNLLRKNKEIESNHTNSTFGFFQYPKKSTLKNQKSYFLPTQ